MNDLISRQAALKELSHALLGKEWDEALTRAIIESVPTIDPVKHGKWEHNVNKNGFLMWTCSICKCEKHKKKGLKFCPNCGARMDGVEKIGHWVDHIKDFWCSECGCRILPEQVDSFSKCPNCGARMDGEE